MDINRVLPTIQTFSDLRPITEQADVHLSFWGSRYLTVNGYEGSLPIDSLVEHLYKMLRQRPNFDDTENRHGIVIENRIDHFYEKSDDLVNHSNCFTMLIVRISDFVSSIYTTLFKGQYTTRYSWDGEIPGMKLFRERG